MDVHVKPVIKRRTGDYTTISNDYVVVPDDVTGEEYFGVKGYKSKIIQLVCTLNNLLYKIDASLDATTWHQIKAEDTLNADAVAYDTSTEPWEYIRVQVKPAVAATHGKLAVTLGMSSL